MGFRIPLGVLERDVCGHKFQLYRIFFHQTTPPKNRLQIQFACTLVGPKCSEMHNSFHRLAAWLSTCALIGGLKQCSRFLEESSWFESYDHLIPLCVAWSAQLVNSSSTVVNSLISCERRPAPSKVRASRVQRSRWSVQRTPAKTLRVELRRSPRSKRNSERKRVN